ncbi:GtrA family protein [Virgibacillus sp. NKC19-3]|uniref:GtrA family protein n=1 Tax=Virgibacillus saliphilus TaxID=2831674 RepID=UPI001C9B4AD0|nr:GtrA family protein [Virgibacillus sp. NKC19-3]MBY7142969.1 GtrA family protein [Virgibacillus sp. NKC19-3]
MKKHRRKRGPFQFFQYSVIGIVNAGIDIGVLNLLLLLFHTEGSSMLVLYNTIAYTLSVANSYFWNASITFQHSAEGSNRQRITFVIQAIVSLGVNNLVFLGVNSLFFALGVPSWLRYNLAKGIAMFLSFCSSFFMIKYFVFTRNKKAKR